MSSGSSYYYNGVGRRVGRGKTGDDGEEEEEEEEEVDGQDLAAWERAYADERSWESLQEDESGLLRPIDTKTLHHAQYRRRLLLRTAAAAGDSASAAPRIQKGLIRYLYVVIDFSRAASETDYRPSRMAVVAKSVEMFIREYFDQNPLSHIGLITIKDGLAHRLTELGGSPEAQSKALMGKLECSGDASLQNALDLVHGFLSQVPSYGHREVLILYSALSTCDPGDIIETIQKCKKAKIRCSVVGLSAEIYICKHICSETGGSYTVALDETHLKELLLEHAPPPPAIAEYAVANLIKMGFPQRGAEGVVAICSCHKEPKVGGGYTCPRCYARVCELPTECNICGLTLVSSPHLARSYHHLFPVTPFDEVLVGSLHSLQKTPRTCFGCQQDLISHGSGSASSICELLSYFRGGEQAVLLWDVLVDVYASLEMPHDAFFALSKMNNQGMQASIFTYNSLMHSLRNTDAVWDLYGVVQAEGLPCSDCMYNVLISHLCNQGRLQDAVSFFEDKRGTGVLTPCIVTFNILIAGCCRLGSVRIAKSFISMLIKCGLFPDKYTYTPLIYALCLEGSIMEALALSEDMEKKGVEIDMFICNSLLKGLCLNQMMHMVWKVFKMMVMKGLHLDYETYRILMIGHFQHGKINEGLRLKEEILANGFQLNIFTYSILLHALYKSGLNNEVELLLSEIHYFGLDLDHVAYSTLIHFYCKRGEVDRALHVFNLMCATGIMPNSFNHLSVILAFCKKGMLLEARRYLESLVTRGLSVDVFLFNALMDGFVKAGDLHSALSLYGEMIKYGISPSVATINSLIDGFCHGGKLVEAKALYGTMQLQGLIPNTVTYTILMDAYGKVHDVNSMIQLFDEMVDNAVMPNVVTYSVVIKGFCEAGGLEKALFILRDMQSKGIFADEIIFNTLIQGFCKAKDIEGAFRLHDEMSKYFQPTPVTYNILIDALCTPHCLRKAETLVDMLLEKGVRLKKFAFTTVIKAQCAMGNPWKAVILFDKMIQAGFEISLKDFAGVINRLCKRQHMNYVKIFFNMMLQAGIFPDQMLLNRMAVGFRKENDFVSMSILQCKLITSGLTSN